MIRTSCDIDVGGVVQSPGAPCRGPGCTFPGAIRTRAPPGCLASRRCISTASPIASRTGLCSTHRCTEPGTDQSLHQSQAIHSALGGFYSAHREDPNVPKPVFYSKFRDSRRTDSPRGTNRPPRLSSSNESEEYDKLVRQAASHRSVTPHVSGRSL